MAQPTAENLGPLPADASAASPSSPTRRAAVLGLVSLLAVLGIGFLRRQALEEWWLELRHAWLLTPWTYRTALAGYAVAAVVHLTSIFLPGSALYRLGRAIFGAALGFNIAQVAGQWIETGRPPFKTLYEVSIYIDMIVAGILIAIEWIRPARLVSFLVAVLALAVGVYALDHVDAEVVKIPPALQNPIMIPHVTSYITAYSAMGIAFLTGWLSLIWPGRMDLSGGGLRHRLLRNSLGGRTVDYEQFTYSLIRFGFVFLTAALLLGSVWGKQAWSDWWFWDPKENWALITWLIYLAYLHMRKEARFRGRRAVVFSLIGFTAVTFTYIGMKYLPVADQSEHVYTD